MVKTVVAALMVLPWVAHAESIQQFLEPIIVTGIIRSYYFNRLYGDSELPDKYAYSLGGMIKAQTVPLYGVSAGWRFTPPTVLAPMMSTCRDIPISMLCRGRKR